MSNPERILSWRQAAASGILWGSAVAIVSTITQPLFGLPFSDVARFLAQLLLQWWLTGLFLALGARRCSGRRAGVEGMLLLLATCALAFMIQWLVWRSTALAGIRNDAITGLVPATDLGLYSAWLNLFFGGLYLAGYFAMRRTLLMRRQLAAYRLARSEADALLRESRVNAFRGQLQPGMLLAALAALRQRYEDDRTQGDALFDELVAFLRAAMPSVRSGVSTLAAELETVRHYARLRGSLRSDGAQWRLACDAPPALPFPSLVLLPAIDAISRAMPNDATITVGLHSSAGRVTLRLSASHEAALPELLDQRLRAGLALSFGRAAHLSQGRGLPLILRLPDHLAASAEPFPFQGGEHATIFSDAARGDDDCGLVVGG